VSLNDLLNCLSNDENFNLTYFGIKSNDINPLQKEVSGVKIIGIFHFSFIYFLFIFIENQSQNEGYLLKIFTIKYFKKIFVLN
jgi:hypothetical protein